MKLISAAVLYFIIIIHFFDFVSATASTTIDGIQQFILDTMDHFGSTTPVFVTHGDNCCCSEMASSVAIVSICYKNDIEALDVLKRMQWLEDLNEFNMIFFMGNGHENLLRMSIGNFDLISCGVPLVMSYEPDKTILKLRLDSKLFFFNLLGANIHLSEIYSVKSGQPIMQKFGVWSVETGLVVNTPNMWERRADLMGLQLECVTQEYAFMTQVHHDNKSEKLPRVTGLFVDYLRHLESHLNFTANVGLSQDVKWGALEEDGSTWNGIVGMLIYNKTDIATAGLTRTLQRSIVIDFSISLEVELTTLIVARRVISNMLSSLSSYTVK
jgi:hypothetical protein